MKDACSSPDAIQSGDAWLAPATSIRIRILRRCAAGSWRTASRSTPMWSVAVLLPTPGAQRHHQQFPGVVAGHQDRMKVDDRRPRRCMT